MPEKGEILDCGCGPGQDSELFSKSGYNVTGIDLTSEFIEAAKKRVPLAKFICMDMREISLPVQVFDGIWVSFSLLHIHKKDVQRVFDGLRRVLKPKGIMMIAIHRGPKTKWVDAKISGMDRDCKVQEWVQADFEKELENARFQTIYSRPFIRKGGRFPLLSVMVQLG